MNVTEAAGASRGVALPSKQNQAAVRHERERCTPAACGLVEGRALDPARALRLLRERSPRRFHVGGNPFRNVAQLEGGACERRGLRAT